MTTLEYNGAGLIQGAVGALDTPRLRITPIELEDAAFCLELVNTPGWLGFIGDRGVHDVDGARRFLDAGFLATRREHGFGYHVARLHSGVAIGIAGFLKKPVLENPDFGFAFLPDYQGRGYALEAAGAVLDAGIASHGFPALDAVSRHDNFRSHRLLEKLGFSRVERLDNETLIYRLALGRTRRPGQ